MLTPSLVLAYLMRGSIAALFYVIDAHLDTLLRVAFPSHLRIPARIITIGLAARRTLTAPLVT